MLDTPSSVVDVSPSVSVTSTTVVDCSVEVEGHVTIVHGNVSIASPRQLPPFLAGITMALSLFLKDSPQVAEHFPQSLQTDHRQSEGNTVTFITGSEDVDVSGNGVTLSLSKHVFVSGPKLNAGGQVQT